MKYDKVIIKQVADEENKSAQGLNKYNRSRFPGCVDTLYVAEFGGKFITGIDPLGIDVESIKDADEREKVREEKKAIFENLKLRLPAYNLEPTSDFWTTFGIVISTDQDLVLNKFNALDVLKYHALIANGYVLPNKDFIGNPKYNNCKYYCHVEEVAEKEKISTQKLRDSAKGELSKIAQDSERMLLVGRFLEGGKYKNRMLPDTLYGNLSDYIDDRKNPDNVTNFIKAIKTPVEDLQFKVTIDTAIKKKIIKFINGQYTRGGANLGKTALDVLNNLKSPEFATEFLQIHDEINNRE